MGIRELFLECGHEGPEKGVDTFPDVLKDRFHVQCCLGDMVLTHEWQGGNGQKEVRMTDAETRGVQWNWGSEGGRHTMPALCLVDSEGQEEIGIPLQLWKTQHRKWARD